MTARIVDAILGSDLTAPYAVLVWLGVILALIWSITMRDDPANAGLPEWDKRLRRAGVLIMVGGFLLTVLFGGNQGWVPWPPMIVIITGFDFYLGSAIFTTNRRRALRDKFEALHRAELARF